MQHCETVRKTQACAVQMAVQPVGPLCELKDSWWHHPHLTMAYIIPGMSSDVLSAFGRDLAEAQKALRNEAASMQEQQELLQHRLIQAEDNAALVRSESSHNMQIYIHDAELLWRGSSNLMLQAWRCGCADQYMQALDICCLEQGEACAVTTA